jgi:hypothetical protein
VERRGQLVHQVARHRDAIALALHLELGAREGVGSQRGGMQEGQVRRVEQVLDQQQVVRLDVQVVAAVAPRRIVHPVEVLDQRRVGLRRLAHPDPDPVVLLDDGIGADLRARGDHVLRRHSHALAGRIELQAMVGTLDDVADQPAHRQRRLAMAAAVFERNRFSRICSEKNHGFVQKDAALHRARHLVVPRADVPRVTHEHGRLFFRETLM